MIAAIVLLPDTLGRDSMDGTIARAGAPSAHGRLYVTMCGRGRILCLMAVSPGGQISQVSAWVF